MKTFLRTLFAATVLGALVAGCGGGGGGGGGISTLDTVRPQIVQVLPFNNATSVGTTTPIVITFSEPMNNATVPGAFTLSTGGVSVAGAFSYNGATATFRPSAPLAANIPYTATIEATATDVAGNALASRLTWTFTTGSGADVTVPTVQSFVPAGSDVGINSIIAVTFSEPMDSGSVETAFTLTRGSTNIPGTLTFIGETAVFTPNAFLDAATPYTVTISTAAKDLAGTGMAAPLTWSFTTKSATPSNPGADVDSPAVVTNANSPSPTGTGVPLDSPISVSFDEPIAPFYYGSINGYPTRVTIDYTTNTVTMTPTTNLFENTTYTVVIQLHDLSGNLMPVPFSWSFTTVDLP